MPSESDRRMLMDAERGGCQRVNYPTSASLSTSTSTPSMWSSVLVLRMYVSRHSVLVTWNVQTNFRQACLFGNKKHCMQHSVLLLHLWEHRNLRPLPTGSAISLNRGVIENCLNCGKLYSNVCYYLGGHEMPSTIF